LEGGLWKIVGVESYNTERVSEDVYVKELTFPLSLHETYVPLYFVSRRIWIIIRFIY
jgi:hypothetical protein